MAIDFIGKGLNVAVGVASGYLTKQDMTAPAKVKFLDKNANKLALVAGLGGTAIEMWMPKYRNYAEPIAASGLTLLGRSLYFELLAGDNGATPPVDWKDLHPGISEFPASMTMVPHARRAARNYVPEFEGVNAT